MPGPVPGTFIQGGELGGRGPDREPDPVMRSYVILYGAAALVNGRSSMGG